MSAVRRIDFAAGRAAIKARPQREAAAQEIADQLFRCEASFDSGVSEVAALMSSLVKARRGAGLSITVGQEMLDETAEAQRLIVAGLQRLGTVHSKGLLLAQQFGLRMDFGDNGGDKHPDFVGGA